MVPAQQALDEVRFHRTFYSRAEAGRLLEVPASTIGDWVRGYRYRSGGQLRSAAPLVVPPSGGSSLSFVNLVEAHTVAAFRASAISMQRLRPALAYLVDQLGIEHPLASRHLLTDGVELFFRYVRAESDGQ